MVLPFGLLKDLFFLHGIAIAPLPTSTVLVWWLTYNQPRTSPREPSNETKPSYGTRVLEYGTQRVGNLVGCGNLGNTRSGFCGTAATIHPISPVSHAMPWYVIGAAVLIPVPFQMSMDVVLHTAW